MLYKGATSRESIFTRTNCMRKVAVPRPPFPYAANTHIHLDSHGTERKSGPVILRQLRPNILEFLVQRKILHPIRSTTER
jgi:hypothetical protein